MSCSLDARSCKLPVSILEQGKSGCECRDIYDSQSEQPWECCESESESESDIPVPKKTSEQIQFEPTGNSKSETSEASTEYHSIDIPMRPEAVIDSYGYHVRNKMLPTATVPKPSSTFTKLPDLNSTTGKKSYNPAIPTKLDDSVAVLFEARRKEVMKSILKKPDAPPAAVGPILPTSAANAMVKKTLTAEVPKEAAPEEEIIFSDPLNVSPGLVSAVVGVAISVLTATMAMA
jgi:hypothetical protein